MTDVRISKAKLKDGQLHVELEAHDKDTERHTVVKCAQDKLHAGLLEAFAALSPSVREILEWPSNLYGAEFGVDPELRHHDRIRVTGVSWSYSESVDVEGACIVFQVDLENCTSPFCGTTPHLPFDQYSEDGNQPIMPVGAQDALNSLKAEVQAFLDGKRAQGDLFSDRDERIETIGAAHGMRRDTIDAVKKGFRDLTADGICTIKVSAAR